MSADTPFAHGIARVRLSHVIDGMRQSNVFHVMDLSGEASVEHYQAILTAFVFWWQFGYEAGAPPASFVGRDASLELSTIEFIVSHLPLGPLQVLFDLTTVSSLGPSPPLPAGATPALSWKTAFEGRHGTGRSYLVGFDSGLLEDGNTSYVHPAAATLIEDAYTALIPALHDATDPPGLFALALYHRNGRSVGGGSRVFGDPLVRARFHDRLIDTQRPRLPGHRK